MRTGLVEVGAVVRERAVRLFKEQAGRDVTAEQQALYDASAEGFKVRVRATGIVDVEQSKRRTSGQHPEYGGLMMTEGLLPARDEKINEATEILERHVVSTLHEHGLT